MNNIKKRVLSLIKSIILQIIYSFICRNILKYLLHVKFNHTESLHSQKQFIIIANHTSHMDTVCLMSAIPHSKIISVRPISAIDYFGKSKIQACLSNFFINSLLVDRKLTLNVREQFVGKILEALDEGYSIIIYPEGTRSKTGNIQDLKFGISYILQERPYIHYIPTYLKGMRYLLSFKNIFIPSKASVTFGTPSLIKSHENKEIMAEIKNNLLDLSAYKTTNQS